MATGIPSIFKGKEDGRIVSYDWAEMGTALGYIEFETIASASPSDGSNCYLSPVRVASRMNIKTWSDITIAGNDNDTLTCVSYVFTGNTYLKGKAYTKFSFASNNEIDNLKVEVRINAGDWVTKHNAIVSAATVYSYTTFRNLTEELKLTGSFITLEIKFTQTDAGTNTISVAHDPNNAEVVATAATFPAGVSNLPLMLPIKRDI